jgi:CBS domain-containing protein
MKAADIMTRQVVTIEAAAPIATAVRLMLQNRISGLPVVNPAGKLVGIVTEGDFLRRAETGTEMRRARWLEFVLGPGRSASDYVRSHARRVDEVMTPDVASVTQDTPLDEIVQLMEKRHIKRVPVTEDGKIVGIVSRANLLHALAGVIAEVPPTTVDDEVLRERILAEFDKQSWVPRAGINVMVRNGVADLWGTILDERERPALRVVVENVLGVKAVEDHLCWVEPMSGWVIETPEDEAQPKAQGRG